MNGLVAEDLNDSHLEEIKSVISNSIKAGTPIHFENVSKFNDIENELILSAQRAVEVVVKAKLELDINIKRVFIHQSFRERQNDFIYVLSTTDKESDKFIKIFSIVRDVKKKSPSMKYLFLSENNLNSDLLIADGYKQVVDIVSISKSR